jgi:hypothetical protein
MVTKIKDYFSKEGVQKVAIYVLVGKSADLIIANSQQRGSDLIVLTTHKNTGISRVRQCVRQRCPLDKIVH